MNKNYVLKAENIQKEYLHPEKVLILRNISLELSPGKSLAIVGSSGCGKSTLLNILGTLEEPTRGVLYFYGKKITRRMVPLIRNQHYGFVFQNANLLEEYSLLDNLLLKAKIGRKSTTPNSPSYQEALSLISLVDLNHRTHFPAKYLSGGEKQRAAIARAFMNQPDLILADEPTGNLDQFCAEHIQMIFIQCCKHLKRSLILVTHDTAFAKKMDSLVYLKNGLFS